MSRLKALREQRAKLVSDAQAILRMNNITPEFRAKFDRMMAEADKMKVEIDKIEAESNVATPEQRMATHWGGIFDKDGVRYDTPQEREHRMSFTGYLREGVVDQLLASKRAGIEKRDGQLAGTQSISYTQGAAGGYFVPAGFVYDVDVAMKYYAPLMDGTICRILETATGAVLPYPTSNDTGNSATLVGESVQSTEKDLTADVVNFGAYKYSSGVVKVSLELLQDSAFDLEAFLKQQFAIRFGRAYESYFTNGTGSSQPTGLLTAIAASGATPVVASGSSTNDGSSATGATSIGTNDLIDLEHSVDPVYRRGGKFMVNDDTLRQIKQLLDKYGRPIWLPGLAVNAPDTILGYSYVINQSMPKIAASATTVAFGDFSKFIIRKVRELSVLRLVERYADYGQVGFIGFSRADSNLVDAGTHPINVLQQAS